MLLSFGAQAGVESDRHPLPEGFVYLDVAIPDIAVELRYFTSDNFVGRPVDGYVHAHAILSKPAAAALARVQESLRPFGLGLKVFDAYRPQRAVDHFVRWAADLQDRETKAKYYPRVAKKDLFSEGYIAARSSHSRGSTVDLTIVFRAPDGTVKELDMGSSWDFFGPISWPASDAVSAQQRANRTLLRTLMMNHGFQPYTQEWWHFTLRNEPHPETYFDFPN
jgi:D-alanyl-D-alanine dipeptidase